MRRLVMLALLALPAPGCGDDSGLPDARVNDGRPTGGTISLSWMLSDGGTAATCDQVGAGTVTVKIFPKNVGFAITDAFLCTQGMGTTLVVDAGTYEVELSLGAGAGGSVATLPRIKDIVVRNGQDTPLGAVTFEVDTTGGLQFRLVAMGATANCTAAGAGGAAIEGVALAVRTLDDVCVPATFEIAAGALRPALTYVNDCNAPPPAPCIDEDQRITVASLPSGRHTLIRQGLIGGTACWAGESIVRVPAAGAVTDLTAITMIRTGATGCPAAPP